MNGALIQTSTITAVSAAMPTAIDEGNAQASVNLKVLGSNVQPGLSVLADVDPMNSVQESNEADNQFPLSGTPLSINVHTAPPLRIVLVPILQTANGLQGRLTTANGSAFLEFATKVHPYPYYDAFVRAPYTTSAPALDPSNSNGSWAQILTEIAAIQAAEGYAAYNYYGVVQVNYNSGIVGLANLPGKAGMGVDWASEGAATFAHEIGHNWGRKHAPCGNPAGIDPSYPYANAGIGGYGIDVDGDSLVTPLGRADVMSYCEPYWVSGYTYQGVLNYRDTASSPRVIGSPTPARVLSRTVAQSRSIRALGGFTGSDVSATSSSSVSSAQIGTALTGQPQEPCLILWGRITRAGLILEPSFVATTAPRMPERDGPYTIDGTNQSGNRVFSLAFKPDSVEDLAGGVQIFAFAIPERIVRSNELANIRLSGEGRAIDMKAGSLGAAAIPTTPRVIFHDRGTGETELTWDSKVYPLLVVRDLQSGAIVSLARGGSARVRSKNNQFEFTLSDKVRSTKDRGLNRQ
jgi:hypothetical protein